MNITNSDFWTPISLAEFNDRTEHAYAPLTAFTIAHEHWVDRKGVLLGVVTLDRLDRDWGYVVLGRDERGRFRAIDAACSLPSLKKARDALQGSMREISESGATLFPQDCLQ